MAGDLKLLNKLEKKSIAEDLSSALIILGLEK